MISSKELSLLLELSKLLNKYGDKTFHKLVESLRDEYFLSSLELLAESATKIKAGTTKTRVDYAQKINTLLGEFQESDQSKYELLKELENILTSKQCFGTLKQFSEYLKGNGIYHEGVKTWPHGKFILLSYFSNKKPEEIKINIDKISQIQHMDDRSLDAWSSVIMKGDK